MTHSTGFLPQPCLVPSTIIYCANIACAHTTGQEDYCWFMQVQSREVSALKGQLGQGQLGQAQGQLAYQHRAYSALQDKAAIPELMMMVSAYLCCVLAEPCCISPTSSLCNYRIMVFMLHANLLCDLRLRQCCCRCESHTC